MGYNLAFLKSSTAALFVKENLTSLPMLYPDGTRAGVSQALDSVGIRSLPSRHVDWIHSYVLSHTW